VTANIALTANRHSFVKRLGTDAARWISASPMFVLPYPLDRNAFAAVAAHILQTNDGLRMQVNFEEEDITQVLGSQYDCLRIADFEIDIRAIDHVGELGNVSAYTAMVREEIDVRREGFRLCVFPVEGNSAFGLVIVSHHILIDAVSVHSILHQVRQNYVAFLERNVPAAAMPGSYIDYVSSYYAACISGQSEVDEWRTITPRLRHHLGAVEEYNSASTETGRTYHTFSPQEAQKLLSQPGINGKKDVVPRFLSAISYALREWQYQIPPVLSLVVAGRQGLPTTTKLHSTVGYISDTIPICLDNWVSHEESAQDIAEQLDRIRRIGRQFGFSRHLSEDTEITEEFKAHAHPFISLNVKIAPFRGLDVLGVRSVQFGWNYNWVGRRAFPISGGLDLDEKGGLTLAWDYDLDWARGGDVQELLNRCVHNIRAGS
jgi:hypothetical protein